MPSLCGIFVNRLVMSIDTRNVFLTSIDTRNVFLLTSVFFNKIDKVSVSLKTLVF